MPGRTTIVRSAVLAGVEHELLVLRPPGDVRRRDRRGVSSSAGLLVLPSTHTPDV